MLPCAFSVPTSKIRVTRRHRSRDRRGVFVERPALYNAIVGNYCRSSASSVREHDAPMSFLLGIGVPSHTATELLLPTDRRRERDTSEGEDASNEEERLHRIQTICNILIESCGIRVMELRHVLNKQVLETNPTELRAHIVELQRMWSTVPMLRSAIYNDSSVLDPSYLPDMKRCARSLQDMGFSEEQTASLLSKAPSVARWKRFELQRALRSVGIQFDRKSTGSTPPTTDIDLVSLRKLVTRRPQECLLSSLAGNDSLVRLLEIFQREAKLEKEKAVVAISRCPPVLDVSTRELESRFQLLRDHGLSDSQIGQLVTACPEGFLRCPSSQLDTTLALLNRFGFRGADSLLQYPRCFVHLPLRVIGPRLAYLMSYKKEQLSKLSLSTILSRGDAQFVADYVDQGAHFYDIFRTNFNVKWMRKEGSPPLNRYKHDSESEVEENAVKIVPQQTPNQSGFKKQIEGKESKPPSPVLHERRHSKSNVEEEPRKKFRHHTGRKKDAAPPSANQSPSLSADDSKKEQHALSKREIRRRQFWQQRRSKQIGKLLRQRQGSSMPSPGKDKEAKQRE